MIISRPQVWRVAGIVEGVWLWSSIAMASYGNKNFLSCNTLVENFFRYLPHFSTCFSNWKNIIWPVVKLCFQFI